MMSKPGGIVTMGAPIGGASVDIVSALASTGRIYTDATDIEVADAADVTFWPNRFTTYSDLAEATNPPTWDDSEQAVYFDGTTSLIKTSGMADIANACVVWAYLKQDGSQHYKYPVDSFSSDRRIISAAVLAGDKKWITFSPGELVMGENVPGTWQWVRMVWDGASSEGVVDGVANSLTTVGSNAKDFTLGAAYDGSGGHWKGWFRRFVVGGGSVCLSNQHSRQAHRSLRRGINELQP